MLARDALGLVGALTRFGALPEAVVDGGKEEERVLEAVREGLMLAEEVAGRCRPLLESTLRDESAPKWPSTGGAAAARPQKRALENGSETLHAEAGATSDDVGSCLTTFGLTQALQDAARKSLTPQGVRLVSRNVVADGSGPKQNLRLAASGSATAASADEQPFHRYTGVMTELLALLTLRLVWAGGSGSGAAKQSSDSSVNNSSSDSDKRSSSSGGSGGSRDLSVQPQRSSEARSWASLLGRGAVSLLCSATDAAVGVTATAQGGADAEVDKQSSPAVCMLQGRCGGAAALPLSAALVARYVRLRHPHVKRLAVVQGVSAGSAAAVLATNRRLLADWDATDEQGQHSSALRPLMISVLLEGGAGLGTGGTAAATSAHSAAEERKNESEGSSSSSSSSVGWEWRVVDGRRLRVRAEVAAAVRDYKPDLLLICCADEGWLPSASYLIDDHTIARTRNHQQKKHGQTAESAAAGIGGGGGGGGGGNSSGSWENSEPASRAWLPLLAELTAGMPPTTPTLALLGTPHACSHTRGGKTGVAAMLAQVFVLGCGAVQKVVPSQTKRQKTGGGENAVPVGANAEGHFRVERICGKRVAQSASTDAAAAGPAAAAETADESENMDVATTDDDGSDKPKDKEADADKQPEATGEQKKNEEPEATDKKKADGEDEEEKGDVEYLVKWFGLGDAHATWEPEAVRTDPSLITLASHTWLWLQRELYEAHSPCLHYQTPAKMHFDAF